MLRSQEAKLTYSTTYLVCGKDTTAMQAIQAIASGGQGVPGWTAHYAWAGRRPALLLPAFLVLGCPASYKCPQAAGGVQIALFAGPPCQTMDCSVGGERLNVDELQPKTQNTSTKACSPCMQ